MKKHIEAIPTPNPNAMKFILEKAVKDHGKSIYNSQTESANNYLASKLFEIGGIDRLFFRDNTITITKKSLASWTTLISDIENCISNNLDNHSSSFSDIDLEAIRREKLPPKLKQIEEILDKEIRPTLRFDGGDVELIELVSNCLVIKYQGACGTCPSSASGTLHAIQQTLAQNFDPSITVIIDPER